MNIIISNATIKNGNRGCVALAVSAMFILDKLLNERGIEHTFYLPNSGYNKKEEAIIKAGDLKVPFVALFDMSPYSLKRRLKNLAFYNEYKLTKQAFKNADFILDIGQGDSFADIYGKERFDWIYSSYQLAMKHKKPLCILPQTVGPFDDPAIYNRARKGIDYAQCVMTRDKQSLDFVKSMLPGKEVTEIIDVAFFMPYKAKKFDSNFTHVGLNISSLLWHGGYTRDNQFGLVADYPAVIRSIIDYFLSLPSVKLHLIPHVVGAEQHVENDYAVSYELCEQYDNPRLALSPLFLDPIAAKNYIAGMDFFMGARMHSTIAAFSSGVPVVPMAYSRKFNGLFIDTLKYNHLADLKTLEQSQILAMIKECFDQRQALKAQIDTANDSIVKAKYEALEKQLVKFLGL